MRSPLGLFRKVAIAEAVTWALLILGMVLKYGTETTDLGVRVFGMLHGIVFVAYCVTTVVVAVDQRWSLGRAVLGLASAVPPFVTVVFDQVVERRGGLGTTWRLRTEQPAGVLEKPVAWLLRERLRGLAAGVVAVAALTGLALLVGPPAS
ncbi:DUF3817 domain-containing protein [Nocardioides bruguierae]|uniref:DUF3817 domain-containing protein n=1 Tax=Nocardioides bruguierae TaxID=2945102 RepID=UPI002020E25E|nr:DUF3817 domain-containing protein [Nocardioides bruguierae]MCL8023921.1 DUF3817 domain-containing protein [Nocardioides bruguierae]